MSLKELTKAKHETAEKLPFINKIFQKKVTPEEYLKYLYQMQPVYEALENKAKALGILNDLKGLERASRIQEDINELQETTSLKYYMHFPVTDEYLNYLKQMSDPKKVLAHLYVRHMGDLYGGQMLRLCVPGSAKWYWFDNAPELISKLRGLITVDLADEANVALDYSIKIIEQLS
jgi:heme oxygenase